MIFAYRGLQPIKREFTGIAKCLKRWWPGTELNRRRQPFQGCALPPELPGHAGSPLGCRDPGRLGPTPTYPGTAWNCGQSKYQKRVLLRRL